MNNDSIHIPLLDRILCPTFKSRCVFIAHELDNDISQYSCIVKHGRLTIGCSFLDHIVISIDNIEVYNNGFRSIKSDCKQKIKFIINELYIKAHEHKYERYVNEINNKQNELNQLNKLCKEL